MSLLRNFITKIADKIIAKNSIFEDTGEWLLQNKVYTTIDITQKISEIDQRLKKKSKTWVLFGSWLLNYHCNRSLKVRDIDILLLSEYGKLIDEDLYWCDIFALVPRHNPSYYTEQKTIIWFNGSVQTMFKINNDPLLIKNIQDIYWPWLLIPPKDFLFYLYKGYKDFLHMDHQTIISQQLESTLLWEEYLLWSKEDLFSYLTMLILPIPPSYMTEYLSFDNTHQLTQKTIEQINILFSSTPSSIS